METEERPPSTISNGDIVISEGYFHAVLFVENHFDDFYFVGTVSVQNGQETADVAISSIEDIAEHVNFFRFYTGNTYEVVVNPAECTELSELVTATSEAEPALTTLSEFSASSNEGQASLDSF